MARLEKELNEPENAVEQSAGPSAANEEQQ
jgi:hypothetical protein